MKPTVLVVEDHDDARTIVTRFLEFSGYDVSSAINGKDALEKIETGLRPCLILLDLMMPVMDGITFGERLRALPDANAAQTPVVLLTGAHDVESARRRIQAVEVIQKPASYTRVLDVVEHHCRQ